MGLYLQRKLIGVDAIVFRCQMKHILIRLNGHVEDLRVTDASRVRTQSLLLLVVIVNSDVQALMIVDRDQLTLRVQLDVRRIGDVVRLLDLTQVLPVIREHLDRVQMIVRDEDLVVVRADRRGKLQLLVEMEQRQNLALQREDVQLLDLRLDDENAVRLIDAERAWLLEMLTEATDELSLAAEHVNLRSRMPLDDDELIATTGHHSDAVRIEQVLAAGSSTTAERVFELAGLAVEDFDAVGVGVDHGKFARLEPGDAVGLAKGVVTIAVLAQRTVPFQHLPGCAILVSSF